MYPLRITIGTVISYRAMRNSVSAKFRDVSLEMSVTVSYLAVWSGPTIKSKKSKFREADQCGENLKRWGPDVLICSKPVFIGLAVVKVSLRMATYQHVRPHLGPI